MEIILLQDIDKVGDKYDIVKVKDGYGRNYLIPNGMAIIANTANRQKLDDFKAKEAAELAARVSEFQ
ncbi:50S ribosomal protein L9, partial [Arthrospira platensis SPKY1]|nr:50S ribosomal protein L9 [Arthrospira platensis SPKY1]